MCLEQFGRGRSVSPLICNAVRERNTKFNVRVKKCQQKTTFAGLTDMPWYFWSAEGRRPFSRRRAVCNGQKIAIRKTETTVDLKHWPPVDIDDKKNYQSLERSSMLPTWPEFCGQQAGSAETVQKRTSTFVSGFAKSLFQSIRCPFRASPPPSRD